MNGWQRLWELVKWLITIAVGLGCFFGFMPANPPPENSVPSAGQIIIGVMFGSVIASCVTFGLLHALEWVYRGFRPKKTE